MGDGWSLDRIDGRGLDRIDGRSMWNEGIGRVLSGRWVGS